MTVNIRTATTHADAEVLAQAILGARTRPLVLISSNPSTGQFEIDAHDVVEQVGDVAHVWTITTGDSTYALSNLLPPRTEVYRGAGRSYPVGFGADPRPDRSPLRFPGQKAFTNLVDDVLAHANSAGLFTVTTARSVDAHGSVLGILAAGSRALVDVHGHGNATVWHELTFPQVPLDWVLSPGQLVDGDLDLDSRRLTVRPTLHTPQSLASVLPHLCVTYALVGTVTEARATLLLHPEVAITITQGDVSPNPLDTMDLLLAEGDIVAVRVIHLQGDRLHLRLTDIDDDEPVNSAVPLLQGGEPWLLPGRVLMDQRAQVFDPEDLDDASRAPGVTAVHPTAVAAVATDPAHPRPGPGLRHPTAPILTTQPGPPARAPKSGALHTALLELEQARARIHALEDQLRDAGADDSRHRRFEEMVRGSDAQRREVRLELGEALHEIGGLKNELLRTKRALLDARNQRPAGPTGDSRDERMARWAHADDWVRHEIYLAWVARVGSGERRDWPLLPYDCGEQFTPSLSALDDGQFDKAVRTALDVVTGRARSNASRRIHPLRTGTGGDDSDVVRKDGARCFRASIENGTPAARRLHYWQRTDGAIELSRIVTHDVVEP